MVETFPVTRRFLLVSGAAICAAGPAKVLAVGPVSVPGPIVKTSNGPVRGRIEDGLHVFRGLRYAAPPVGKLRFRPPQPVTKWAEVAEASSFRDAALQIPGGGSLPSETHSEDCLYLHLWSQGLDKAKRPVMVWLHGGGYWEGAPGRPVYYGDQLARQGVVLVTVTHRLNVFGFTQLPESWGPEYRSSGLAGMIDIVAALRWVRSNIATFGGDPDNVTIFGESGGGAKVSLLLNMPAANGLYHKAVIQSGAVLNAHPSAYGKALGQALTDIVGVKSGDVAALAAVDARKIFETQDVAVAKVKDLQPPGFWGGNFSPTIDGKELPHMPFAGGAPAAIANVPLLIGSARDEANFFPMASAIAGESDAQFERRVREADPAKAEELILALRTSYPGATPGELSLHLLTGQMFGFDTIRVAQEKARQPAPVFMYRFDWESNAMRGKRKLGAAHAVDVPIIFGTPGTLPTLMGTGDGPARMIPIMQPAWIAFARTGNPSHPGIPAWPRYDNARRATMIFNLQSRVENDPAGAVRKAVTG